MARRPDVDRRWYEVQRLINAYPDGSGGQWLLWEAFPYDHELRQSEPRMTARRAAIRAAKDCATKWSNAVRIIHIQQVYYAENR